MIRRWFERWRTVVRVASWVLEFERGRGGSTRLEVAVTRDGNGRLDAVGAFMAPAPAGRCPECWGFLDQPRPHELSCPETTVDEFLAELGLSADDLMAVHDAVQPEEH